MWTCAPILCILFSNFSRSLCIILLLLIPYGVLNYKQMILWRAWLSDTGSAVNVLTKLHNGNGRRRSCNLHASMVRSCKLVDASRHFSKLWPSTPDAAVFHPAGSYCPHPLGRRCPPYPRILVARQTWVKLGQSSTHHFPLMINNKLSWRANTQQWQWRYLFLMQIIDGSMKKKHIDHWQSKCMDQIYSKLFLIQFICLFQTLEADLLQMVSQTAMTRHQL